MVTILVMRRATGLYKLYTLSSVGALLTKPSSGGRKLDTACQSSALMPKFSTMRMGTRSGEGRRDRRGPRAGMTVASSRSITSAIARDLARVTRLRWCTKGFESKCAAWAVVGWVLWEAGVQAVATAKFVWAGRHQREIRSVRKLLCFHNHNSHYLKLSSEMWKEEIFFIPYI